MSPAEWTSLNRSLVRSSSAISHLRSRIFFLYLWRPHGPCRTRCRLLNLRHTKLQLPIDTHRCFRRVRVLRHYPNRRAALAHVHQRHLERCLSNQPRFSCCSLKSDEGGSQSFLEMPRDHSELQASVAVFGVPRKEAKHLRLGEVRVTSLSGSKVFRQRAIRSRLHLHQSRIEYAIALRS